MKLGIKLMVQIALVTAVICIVSPFSIPIGTIPITFSLLAIYLGLYALDFKAGSLSILLYILLGLVGIPVFSGFRSGPSVLGGPTGGYIVGYILVGLIAGSFIDRFEGKRMLQLLGMLMGLLVCYAFGTGWFVISMENQTLGSALMLCVVPFIPGDLIKLGIAAAIGPVIRRRIKRI